MIFSGMTPPVLAAMALVGVFAIFHGHAHGTEMPVERFRDRSMAWVYGRNGDCCTASASRSALRCWFDEAPRRRVMQTCGVAIGLIGAGLTIVWLIGCATQHRN